MANEKSTLALQRVEESSNRMGAVQRVSSNELSARAAAAQVKAAIEARFIMAMQRPRDLAEVRTRLMLECARPAFAEEAWYTKPVGEGISGLSIRFAETAIQLMGNIEQNTVVTYDDEAMQVVQVSVVDLESNTSYQTSLTIQKTVERRYLKKGQQALSQRVNSSGEITYLVEANEDDLATKRAAAISKAIRTSALRLVPAAIKAEAEEVILRTKKNEMAKDPKAVLNRMTDAFGARGVMPRDLAEYLGHPIDTCTQAELQQLGDLMAQMKEGSVNWNDALAEVRAQRAAKEEAAAKQKVEKLEPKAAQASPAEEAKKADVAPSPPVEVPPKDAEPELPTAGTPMGGTAKVGDLWRAAKQYRIERKRVIMLLEEHGNTTDPASASSAAIASVIAAMAEMANEPGANG